DHDRLTGIAVDLLQHLSERLHSEGEPTGPPGGGFLRVRYSRGCLDFHTVDGRLLASAHENRSEFRPERAQHRDRKNGRTRLHDDPTLNDIDDHPILIAPDIELRAHCD